jgi:hypothetical protein
MKQRHIQSFLMVSAAFFAISAPMGGARANGPPFGATSVPPVAQVRTQTPQMRSGERRDSERSNDDNAA